MADAPVIGYWFSTPDDKLGHGDGRVAVVGQMLTVDPPIVPHQHGLHLSATAWDALRYAPGPVVWLVQGSGTVVPSDNNEYACSERTALARHDITTILGRFACDEAALVMNYWPCPPEISAWLWSGGSRSTASALMPKLVGQSREKLLEAIKNAKEHGNPATNQSTQRSLMKAQSEAHATDAAYYSTFPTPWEAAWRTGMSVAQAQAPWANGEQGVQARFNEYVRRVFNA